MNHLVRATQTIVKYFFVDADNEDIALEKAQTMAEEGEIYFDNDSFLEMELNVDIVNGPNLSQRSL